MCVTRPNLSGVPLTGIPNLNQVLYVYNYYTITIVDKEEILPPCTVVYLVCGFVEEVLVRLDLACLPVVVGLGQLVERILQPSSHIRRGLFIRQLTKLYKCVKVKNTITAFLLVSHFERNIFDTFVWS